MSPSEILDQTLETQKTSIEDLTGLMQSTYISESAKHKFLRSLCCLLISEGMHEGLLQTQRALSKETLK